MVKRRSGKSMRRPMRGAGFWGDVWDGVKSVISPINDIAKKTKIISTIAGATGNPEIGAVASQLGYGRGKFRVPKRGVLLTK